MSLVHHALVLNFHQPAGNLDYLLSLPNPKGEDGWEGKEILYSMDRMPRYLWQVEDRARVHLNLSGTLLETLSDPGFQERTYGIVKCGDLLWHLQNEKIFNVLGSAYYHPVLPLIPKEDWMEQMKRWWGIASHLFWRGEFQGFWPPEMSFCMELIPVLKRLGYRYVIVDSENVEPVDEMSWHELRYRPHIARHEGEEIIVVVRDRDLSNAQESGMELGWFLSEVEARTKYCEFEPLVCTATDGDNGGWFRNFRDKSNFWNAFYIPMLEHVGEDDEHSLRVRPTFIDDYLDTHEPVGEVKITTAAWNTGWHHGKGFVQWTGSKAQKEALERVREVSKRIHKVKHELSVSGKDTQLAEPAYWRLLRAETSCNFFWGESWVDKCHLDLDAAEIEIESVETIIKNKV